MNASLDGAWQKWRRARYHYEALLGESISLPGTIAPYFYRVTAQRHRDGLEYRFHLGEIPAFDPSPWALIAGDCLSNLRAALDHIVYQLHVRHFRGKVSDDAAQESAFPILDHRRRRPTSKWPEIKRLSIKQRRAIEFLQPYNRRHDQWAEVRRALSELNELSRIDRHRNLHVVRAAITGVLVPMNEAWRRTYGFQRQSFFVPLESHAEVFRWTFDSIPPDVPEEMNVHRNVTANICLDEGGVYTTLVPLLEAYINRVEILLRRFAVFLPTRSHARSRTVALEDSVGRLQSPRWPNAR